MKDQNGKNNKVGFAMLFIGAILFSGSGVGVMILNHVFSRAGQVMIRGGAIFLILFAYFIITKQRISLPKTSKKILAIFFIAQPIGNLAFAYSATTIDPTDSVFYLYVAQLTVGLFISKFFFKDEERTSYSWISLAFAGIGLIIYAWPINTNILSIGVLTGLLCGIAEATKNASMREINKSIPDSTTEIQKTNFKLKITSLQYLSAFIGGGIFLLLINEKLSIAPISTTVTLLGIPMNAILTGLAFFIITAIPMTPVLIKGFGNFPTGLGNIVISLELLFAAGMNKLFLNVAPTKNEFIGGITLMLAIIVMRIPDIQNYLHNKREQL